MTSTYGTGNNGYLNDVGYVFSAQKGPFPKSNSLFLVLVDCLCQQVDVVAPFNRRVSASFGQGNGPNMIMIYNYFHKYSSCWEMMEKVCCIHEEKPIMLAQCSWQILADLE